MVGAAPLIAEVSATLLIVSGALVKSGTSRSKRHHAGLARVPFAHGDAQQVAARLQVERLDDAEAGGLHAVRRVGLHVQVHGVAIGA